MKCPTCKKARSRFETHDFLPFCSERCKMTDFGKWLGGEFMVSRSLSVEDEILMEEIPDQSDSPDFE
ncbi:MAG: DNA gyrase inhibitor YacG [Candidatus Omnitrophica bacterium]|nr:DNA gyrase inhibitor YacG [Candidatus Omnitrophota bacterium]